MKKAILIILGMGGLAVGSLIISWPMGLYKIHGKGMGNNLDGRTVVVDKIAYMVGKPGLGDVVIFTGKVVPDATQIGRIWAVPGDSVRIVDGEVAINGQKVAETVSKDLNEVLSGDEYFVMGDNRPNGINVGVHGIIRQGEILGKIWFN